MFLQTKMEVGEFELSFKPDTTANQATLHLLEFEEGISADLKLDNFSGTIQVHKLESKPSKKAELYARQPVFSEYTRQPTQRLPCPAKEIKKWVFGAIWKKWLDVNRT